MKLSNLKARVVFAIGTAGALSALAAVAIPGTFGSFNATTSNPGNSATAGTLQMTNSKSGAAIVSASGLRPGDTPSGTLTITNSGSLSADMYLSESNVAGDAAFGNDLQLQVMDGSTSLYNGALSGMSAPIHLTGSSATKWAPSESHTYTFTVTFPNGGVGADNAYQGKSASAEFDWQGIS